MNQNMKEPVEDVPYKIVPKVEVRSEPTTCLYSRRFLILGLFFMHSMCNSFQWVQYIILSLVMSYYYNDKHYYPVLTFLGYMVIYIPLVFFGILLLEKKGLRFMMLLGSLGNCISAWIKFVSFTPETFYLRLLGHVIATISQIFMLGIPAHLAALWFGREETSRATAFGVLGSHLGLALGYIVPPLLLPYVGDGNLFSSNLGILSFIVAGITTVVMINIFIFFKSKPTLPPSRVKAKTNILKLSYTQSLKKLLKNKSFLIMILSYGFNVGALYAVAGLMKPMLLMYFPHEQNGVEKTVLIFILSTLIGIMSHGIIIDKNQRFKETTVVVYFMCLCGMIGYLGALEIQNLWMVIFLSSLLGFFMGGYIPCALELTVEITYPESEGMATALINASAQIIGLISIVVGTYFLMNINLLAANFFFVGLFALGNILTVLMKADLKRFNEGLPFQEPILEPVKQIVV